MKTMEKIRWQTELEITVRKYKCKCIVINTDSSKHYYFLLLPTVTVFTVTDPVLLELLIVNC